MLPSRTRPFKRDYLAILAKYPRSTPLALISRLENIPLSTLDRNIRKFRLRAPRLTKRAVLSKLLDAINELRTKDMTGPEVCGELTDIIIDTMERP